MKYKIEFTKQFQRDVKLAAKQHRDLERLFEVVDSLQKGGGKHLIQDLKIMN